MADISKIKLPNGTTYDIKARKTICPIYTVVNYAASQTATCNYTYTELKNAYDNGFNIAPLLKVSSVDTIYSANCTITYSNNSFTINIFTIGYAVDKVTEFVNEYDITHSNSSISFNKAIATDYLQQQISDSDWTELPLQTTSTNPIGVQAYTSDYKPKYRKIGNVVDLEGIVKVRSQVSASNADSTFTIGTLPSGFRPPRAIRFFCPGHANTMEHWVLMINSNGVVTGGRYGTSSAVAITTSKALPFNATFMV